MSVESQKKNELDSHKGGPDAGTKSVPRKSQSESGQSTPYPFDTDTAVRDAKEVPGACIMAADVQTLSNKSRLKPASPPEGSSLKDGEKQEYEEGLIGTP